MTTRMIHPHHGATHAYGRGDVERLQGLGWSVEAPTSREPEEAIEDSAEVLKAALAESMRLDPPSEIKRKPGRPRKAQ